MFELKEALELQGKRFGKLVALETVFIGDKKERGWRCKCDCGNCVDVPTYRLIAGYKTTCGCRTEDTINKYIGKKYGHLTVVSFNSKDNKNRNIMNCICECGNQKAVSTKDLERGATTNCGCLTKELNGLKHRGIYGESNKNALISSYRSNAKKKNLMFELSKKELENLFQGRCYYCGIEPSSIIKRKKTYGEYIYNGIDRLDSTKGYTNDNTVSCCRTCNFLKSNYSKNDFLQLIENIYNYRIREKQQTELI